MKKKKPVAKVREYKAKHERYFERILKKIKAYKKKYQTYPDMIILSENIFYELRDNVHCMEAVNIRKGGLSIMGILTEVTIRERVCEVY